MPEDAPAVEQLDNIFALKADQILRPEAQALQPDWKLLRRLRLPDVLDTPTPGAKRSIGLIADTETTGMDPALDEVIQLALLPFSYEPETGKLYKSGDELAYVGLREPRREMSAGAQAVHGITAEMLAGRSINEGRVAKLVERSDFIIAHHAAFDRPMVEKHWPVFRGRPWACSLEDVNWERHGFPAKRLENLAAEYGFFYDSHDALEDCHAVLALLSRRLPDGRQAFAELHETATAERWLVSAWGSPFETRHALSDRGYRWRPDSLPGGKTWWIMTTEPDAERDWLARNVYRGTSGEPSVMRVPPQRRFSDGMWQASALDEPEAPEAAQLELA